MLFFSSMRISKKIPLVISLSAIITSIVIGTLSYNVAFKEELHALEDKAKAILISRENQLHSYLSSIDEEVDILSTNAETIEALKVFQDGWEALESDQEKKLQKLYIDDNKNKTGEKEKLDYANDGSKYSEAHKKHHPSFRKLQQVRGYYDVFLFDKEGNLVYTVFKELDYATNFITGKYKNTDLGKVYRDSISDPEKTHFYDFKGYAPSYGAPASFIGKAIKNEEGTVVGVIAFQMPVDKLNEIMSHKDGLGETGEVYLVGSDHLMRNDSSFSEENDILKTRVENEDITNALTKNEVGVHEIVNYRGKKMVSAYAPFIFKNTKMVMVAEQEEGEMLQGVYQLRDTIIVISIVIALIISVIGFFVARSIVNPIINLISQMNILSDGDNTIEIQYKDRKDEIGEIASSLEIFKQAAIEKDRIEEEQKRLEIRAEEDKKKMMVQLADDFENKVQSIVGSVSAAATEMIATAEGMSGNMSRSNSMVDDANRGASETSDNVQTVAAAVEEMSSSVEEISSQVHKSNDLIINSVKDVEGAEEHAASLLQASNKVSEVIQLIADIAAQINLLALNATIESARAGEAGKGFAVVANEVKNLAGQTDSSIQEVEKVVLEMKSASDDIVQSLEGIKASVDKISDSSGGIASAVEEQSATTSEISRNMQAASHGTSKISENLAEVGQVSSDANEASQEVLSAARGLSEMSEQLDAQIKSFLSEIRS